jgi:hypothetical protein
MNKKSGSIILKTQDEILTRQTVLVAGPNAGVVAGEDIEIFVERFPKKMRGSDKYNKNGIGPDNFDFVIPVEIIDGESYLFISSREIKWIYIEPDVIDLIGATEEFKREWVSSKTDKPC